MAKSKEMHNWLKPELLDGFCKWVTLLLFGGLGVLLLLAIIASFTSSTAVFKILEHLSDIFGFGLLGLGAIYLFVFTPIIMAIFVFLKMKKVNYDFKWLPIKFIVFVLLGLLSTCVLHNIVSENACMDWCLKAGENEETCSLSLCDGPVVW